ncbi:hypothetical protein [Mycoplasmopsis cynos]|uniref:hypothetical protein n=1 Tax=Mycoplasmopsis cynos TaxID=171284 RepID=UPI003A5C8775
MLIPFDLISTKVTPRLLKSISLTNLLSRLKFLTIVVPMTKSSPTSWRFSLYLTKLLLAAIKAVLFPASYSGTNYSINTYLS